MEKIIAKRKLVTLFEQFLKVSKSIKIHCTFVKAKRYEIEFARCFVKECFTEESN